MLAGRIKMANWRAPPKLYIPGPVHTCDDILNALSGYPLGHRAPEYSQLHEEVVTMLKQLLFTEQNVFLVSSSGSGIWEASIRNCIQRDEKVLNIGCGAFSDKYHGVTKSCEREADMVAIEWGKECTVADIDAALAKDNYAAVTVVHNETSTGVTNDIEAIGKMIHEKYPNTLFFVDSVSGMAGLPLKFDQWHIDVVFASMQKAFGVPPGLAVCVVSDRALAKSEMVPGRGYYFDFQEYKKMAAKNQTPQTPAIPQIMALHKRCEMLIAEGMENVWARHKAMADYVRSWATENFELFAPEGCRSNTLTTITNTKGIDIKKVNAALFKKHGWVFGNGYGKLKDKTFRIATMGDVTIDDLKQFTSWIDAEI
jgi:predicted phosphoserine aminotransferase